MSFIGSCIEIASAICQNPQFCVITFMLVWQYAEGGVENPLNQSSRGLCSSFVIACTLIPFYSTHLGPAHVQLNKVFRETKTELPGP